MCVSPPTVIVAFNLYVQRMFMFLFLEKYRLVPVFELLHVSTVLYPDDFFFCISMVTLANCDFGLFTLTVQVAVTPLTEIEQVDVAELE